MKIPLPIFTFYFFIVLLLVSAFLPLLLFWVYFVLIGAGLIMFRLHPKRLWRKTFIYLFLGNMIFFIYFFSDSWLLGKDVPLIQQGLIFLNLYFRMVSALTATLFYRELTTDRDILLVLSRHRLPAKFILLVMIFLRLMHLLTREIMFFVRHFRLRIYRGIKVRYMIPWTKTMFLHFVHQAEIYAMYLYIKNLHEQPETITNIFYDPL